MGWWHRDSAPEEQLIPWQKGLKLWTMQSDSLEPTIPQGSTLLVHTKWCVIHREDIVVFKSPADNLPFLWVMRIRFVPGDVLPEPLRKPDLPPQVPQNQYWVQQDGGLDSRHFGPLHVSQIRGVVVGLLHGGPTFTIEHAPYAGPL